MNSPPAFAPLREPRAPQWRRWWTALLMVWSGLLAALLSLWPEGQPRIEPWLWSTLLPLGWALALAIRLLPWQMALFENSTRRRSREGALQRWWQLRRLSLPVEQVLLLGPAGTAQETFKDLMAAAPAPLPLHPPAVPAPCLRSAVSLADDPRGPRLARHLAMLAQELPALAERWPRMRGLAWSGDTISETAFAAALCEAGLVLPDIRLPLHDLDDLDKLIDAYRYDCDHEDDWLLCAGVISVDRAEGKALPGEGGFLWLVSHRAQQALHRGEYLSPAANESSQAICTQVQGYAELEAPPSSCLAMDADSAAVFVASGWSPQQHQLLGKWGALAQLAPFIGMSLALLQAGESRKPCGWLGQDAEQRLAIGVAVPYGES
jgi:hypothetical protein